MDRKLVIRFRKVFQGLESAISAQVASCCPGLTMAQCQLLLALGDVGRSTVSQLAERLDLDRSTVSRTVEGLVRLGVVSRRRGSRDRRVVLIGLSAKGKSLCQSINDASENYYTRVLELIPAEDLDAVVERFTQLVDAFVRQEARRKNGAGCCG